MTQLLADLRALESAKAEGLLSADEFSKQRRLLLDSDRDVVNSSSLDAMGTMIAAAIKNGLSNTTATEKQPEHEPSVPQKKRKLHVGGQKARSIVVSALVTIQAQTASLLLCIMMVSFSKICFVKIMDLSDIG